MPALLAVAASAALAAGTSHAAGDGPEGGANDGMRGVANPAQARIDYMLKCQGCHRADGTGDARTTPPLNGLVGRFLAVDGGREFLARVPGVASVDLDDARVAQVLNWTLHRYDRANIPAGFVPYSADEIRRLRARPIRLERAGLRAKLVQRMNGAGAGVEQ